MVREKIAGMMIVALAFGVVGLGGGLSAAQASSDATSPAGGSTGGIVIFSPAFGVGPATNTAQAGLLSPPIFAPRGGVIAPPLPMPAMSAPGPALPGILLLQPAPATGSLIVPLRVPPISGVGPSMTQLQLVIPGPNPAQNTSVSLAQLLSTVLASMQPPGAPGGPGQGTSAAPLVSVFSTPSR